ncbi:MAG: DUF1499 domain-containing protein [Caldimonas sp.]
MTLRPSSTSPHAGLRTLALFVLLAAAVAAAIELVAGPGYRFGWWPLGIGLQTMRWAASAALLAAAAGLLVLLRAAIVKSPDVLRIAGAALVIGLVAGGPPAYLWREVQRLPHIHDITTDTARPPAFVAVAPLRRGLPNGVDYLPAVGAQQHAGYPDIAPLVLAGVTPEKAFERARRVAASMGWTAVAEAPSEGRLEATATSMLFGFKDDIVVRIAPQGAGSRIDVRSMSRVGGSDFGVNAKRVRRFLEGVAKSVD